jgi:putative ABC transport system substrate-binding protein
MKRRQFISLLGGVAAAWPLTARAQQPGVPVVGFLDPRSPDTTLDLLRAFRLGLRENGYVERENVMIEYRWADNQLDRLSALANELVRQRVSVIVTSGFAAAQTAKAATSTLPIVFLTGDDPVKSGLVANLPRPASNLTGISFLAAELAAKRFDLLRELLPSANRVAALVNPTNPNVDSTLKEVEGAARVLRLQIQVVNASSRGEINEAFAAALRERPDALFVDGDAFLTSRRVQLVQLSTRHAIPAIYPGRQYVEIGGLMSYGSNLADAFREVGVYTGRILKGAKPADLPVVQASKFELVVNAETARVLGLEIPPSLLARADEVIE